ncbi:MAG: PH domain-containing protein [Saprospiraceae bacterium]|nr:PH domain-containing protein [Pyrinomonadaceae bacterium]
MYCIKCGKENADDAAFCQKCGNAFAAEEETRVARRDSLPARSRSADTSPDQRGEPETKIFSIRPTLKFVYAAYAAAVIGAFLVVALMTVLLPTLSPLIAVVVGLLLLLIPAFYHFKQKLIRYTLTDTTIEIDTGLISRTTQNVPLRRVQDVTVSSTILQRLLGFGNVVIDNAGDDGGKVVLNNIDSPKKYADILLKQMRELER